MIKLKSLILSETYHFEKDNTVMKIPSEKGDFTVRVFKFTRNGTTKYNYDINTPPDHYEEWNGKNIAVGGSVYLGNASTNVEQIYAGLVEQLKKLNLPYIPASQLKILDVDTPERKQFLNKLGDVVKDFEKEMEKPKNQPKKFGSGPPDIGQWITSDEIKNGRLKWVIDNYGDFWLIIKWSYSPRQTIKASELLKNYDRIMSGKKTNDEYAREIFVRNKPFEGI